MRFDEFLILNDVDKEAIVLSKGVFLINSDEGNTMCDVYELFDFYVAFCYKLDRQEKAKITAHYYSDKLPLQMKLDLITSFLFKLN